MRPPLLSESALLPLLLLLLAARATSLPPTPPPSPPGVVVFANATDGYHTFRIPTVAVTPSGTLLVFAEGRARLNLTTADDADCYGAGASAADWKCTNKDVVLRRSADGGATWGPLQVLALANSSAFYTNPQPLAAADGSAAFVCYMRCVSPTGGGSSFVNCTALVQQSTDGGASWGAAVEVPPVQSSAGGFGGVQLASGRLVFSAPGSSKTGVLYSDDGGKSWAFGEPAPGGGGENQVAELAPGQLLMTVRKKNNTRMLFRSSDGGSSWAPGELQAVTDPDCEASMIAVAGGGGGGGGGSFLLFANPHTSGLLPYAEGRQNVTVQRSDDGGRAWQPILLVDQGPSAYTALAQLGGGGGGGGGGGATTCAVLYEESADLPVDFRSIRFVTFDCASGGQPSERARM